MKRKILIVDDDKDIVLAIETILSMEGYTVVHAYNGRDSFITADTEKPDLILLDFMLPDMTGKDIVEVLRKKDGFASTPIVLISAAHGLKEIANQIPIQGLIEKPFEIDHLMTTVEKLVGNTENTSS